MGIFMKKEKEGVSMNCTPKVGQYDMLEITLGVYLCQKGNHIPGSLNEGL
jgi:hypothetical protein